VLERDGLEMILPCHPADAIALAVRASKPIVAHDSALAHARSASNPPDGAAVQDWLDQVSPGDFEEGSRR
jgi:bifunctional DNase/RNase